MAWGTFHLPVLSLYLLSALWGCRAGQVLSHELSSDDPADWDDKLGNGSLPSSELIVQCCVGLPSGQVSQGCGNLEVQTQGLSQVCYSLGEPRYQPLSM